MDATQRADETAAKMRAYFEAHKHERRSDEAADELMLGLLNIVLAEYHTPTRATANEKG